MGGACQFTYSSAIYLYKVDNQVLKSIAGANHGWINELKWMVLRISSLVSPVNVSFMFHYDGILLLVKFPWGWISYKNLPEMTAVKSI